MSPLLRTFAPRRTPYLIHRAALSLSLPRAAGKESALHSENRAQEIEAKKREQVQKRKEGKGHWEEGLASDGEAAVKADRAGSGQDTKQHIKEIQKQAEKVGKQ